MEGLLLAGRYRLGECIGRGGMGRVWRAHDEVLNRTVAVKELTAAQYAQDGDRAVLLARTQTEARAAARINHPAVVTVHDVLEHDERPWIVMELVEGRSLADAVKESGRLDERTAARAGLWVLRALRAAHRAGVLHRDVKPGNVLLAQDGRVLLTDFGIAQVEGDTTLTRTGEVVGSVDYLAPERVRGADPGHASDLWALGATLYTAVEGRSPFRRTTPLTTMQAVVEEEPTVPAHAGVLAPVIAALLRKDPATRPTGEEAEAMLAEAAEGRRPPAAEAYVPTELHRPEPTPWPDTPLPPDPARGPGNTYHPYGSHGGDAYRSEPYGSGPYGREAFEADSYAGGLFAGTPPTGATPHTGGPYPGAPAHGGPRRPRGRTGRIVAVVLAAALIGGGVAVTAQYLGRGGHGDTATTGGGSGGDTGTPSPTPSETEHQTGGVPHDWVRVRDAEGFGLALPEGWRREANGDQIDYTPDEGDHFVRIGIDHSPDFENAYLHQLDLEKQLKRLPAYHRKRLSSNFFRDQPGSVWEFTWTSVDPDPFPGPRRAIEQTYLGRDGVEYAIYMSSPAEDWATTREQFDAVLRGWQPPEGA